MAQTTAGPTRLRMIDADADTRALIASLLRNHTGREYIVESVKHASGAPLSDEAERRVAAALREREGQPGAGGGRPAGGGAGRPRAARATVLSGAENGNRRPAGRRHRARFQQHPYGYRRVRDAPR